MEQVRMGEARGRWVLLAVTLGSGMAQLDATVVNIALPALGRDLGTGFAGLQWTVNGYTLTLASLILLGGSLGDRYGRRRLFVLGTVWFAVASLLCALAPDVQLLVGARMLQGIGGALLTPGSLAILSASFRREDRAQAIGAWSGLGGVAGALGPFLGGVLVGVSWRLVFLINLPLAALVVAVAARHVPESRDEQAGGPLDVAGAALGALGLAGTTYALVGLGDGSWSPRLVASAAAGAAALAAFVVVERRSRAPMLPVAVFADRQFTAANLVTFVVYAALSGVFFLLVVHLQVVAGFAPLVAGTSLLPVTLCLLLLSSRAGALATRIGPRLPMALGPIVSAGGVLLLRRIGPGASYVADVLPGAVVFGLGLALTVAPLTATALAAAADQYAGVASGVNNAVARADSVYAYSLSGSVVLQVLALPVLGALADRAGAKRTVLVASTVVGSLATVLLALVPDGRVAVAVLTLVVANLAFGAALTVYNAYLADVAEPPDRDRVSARGYATGYVGGALVLAVALALVTSAGALGLSKGAAGRLSIALSGAWWLAVGLVAVRRLDAARLLPGVADRDEDGPLRLRDALGSLRASLRALRALPGTARYLTAFLLFNDAVQAVVGLSSVFLVQELYVARGRPEDDATAFLLTLVLLIQVVAAPGATLCARLAHRYGAARVLLGTLVVWVAIVLGAVLALHSQAQAYGLGVLIALVLGGSQSLARSLFASMVPAGRQASFFGFYELAERGTAWIGTLVFALDVTGSYRGALLSLLVLFVSGGLLLARTDTAAAAAAAAAAAGVA